MFYDSFKKRIKGIDLTKDTIKISLNKSGVLEFGDEADDVDDIDFEPATIKADGMWLYKDVPVTPLKRFLSHIPIVKKFISMPWITYIDLTEDEEESKERERRVNGNFDL